MPPKHATQEEKECWETYIDKKFKPIYWIHGSLAASTLLIFLGVTGPLTTEIISLKGNVEKTIETSITEDKAFDKFVTKEQLHKLQKDEHISDIEAIHNPENSEVIYMRQNIREAENLNVSGSRGGGK